MESFFLLLYLFALLGLCIFGLHRIYILVIYYKKRKYKVKPKSLYDKLPVLTVQLPIFNEYNVVSRLITCISKLDYPLSKLHIQVLDDSTDDTKYLCQKTISKVVKEREGLNIEYIHRKNRNGYKAGALENGLNTAKGDYIAIFDADFLPNSDLLKEMIHFFTDEKIGMVQARWGHINQNESLLTKLQSLFLDGHFILEQNARFKSGSFFNFNGTAGMWRKEAIIDAGGWQHDTLTEDLDLSYRAQLKGWEFVFLEDVVVPSELPKNIDGFKSQQHRWTKGSIQTCKKLLGRIWSSDYSLRVKLEASFHLSSNFAYLFLAFLCIALYSSIKYYENYAFSYTIDGLIFLLTFISVTLFYIYAQYLPKKRFLIKSLFYLPILISLGIGMSVNNGKAVLEALFNQNSGFVRTPKFGDNITQKRNYLTIKTIYVQVIELILSAYFLYLSIYAVLNDRWLNLPFLLLFTFGFAFVALLSIFDKFSLKRL